MDALTNPYRPGAGTVPPALVGRDALVDRFGVVARRALMGRPDKSLMPIGLRGVGKTVLLNRFAEIARMEGFEVAQIEAPESNGFDALIATYIRRILLSLANGPVSVAVNKALGVLKSFTLTIPEGYSIRIDSDPYIGLGDSRILSEDITDLLVASGEAAASRQVGVLIVIDELQYLSADMLAALIVALHRTTQLDLPVVLVGAGLPQLPGLAGDAKSYAERLFEFPEIGALTHDDARAALLVPARDQSVEIADDALDRLVHHSGGYPYFLQVWGYHTWNVAPNNVIECSDVDVAEPLVRNDLDSNFFRVRLDRVTPKEREYLQALAMLGPGPHRSGDVAARLGVKVETVAPRRSALIKKGMIYSPAHGDTAFTVPLFDEFMMRVGS